MVLALAAPSQLVTFQTGAKIVYKKKSEEKQTFSSNYTST